MDKSIYVLIFLMVLSITLDLNNKATIKCIGKNKRILPLLIIHHILSIFTYFGWILNDKNFLQIYLFVPPLVAMHWLMNSNCILSEMTNDVCEWRKTKYLNDLVQQMNLKRKSFMDIVKYHYIILIGGYCIALYKYFS
jgi:hypothetical protein